MKCKDSMVTLLVAMALSILFFILLALEQDKLNARIRTLEIKAGLGDRWADGSR